MGILVLLLTAVIFVVSCNSSGAPRPRGHFRIDLPEKLYIVYDSICPFTFEYPAYGVIVTDPGATEPCWFNIEFPRYRGKIHLSYKEVNGNIGLLIEDAHKLAYKHTVKAEAIEENYWENREKNVFGTVYLIQGNAASSIQFYLTDSVSNYLRGSLYFEVQPDKDSLAPVIDFFREDVIHLVESLEWK
ncbi:MAG: gliding motility lipoprotein GldD [Bacteroidia bacterium]|nr:MAG: gliding motility lipoprotein GldD [Bacteroidia bacterium]